MQPCYIVRMYCTVPRAPPLCQVLPVSGAIHLSAQRPLWLLIKFSLPTLANLFCCCPCSSKKTMRGSLSRSFLAHNTLHLSSSFLSLFPQILQIISSLSDSLYVNPQIPLNVGVFSWCFSIFLGFWSTLFPRAFSSYMCSLSWNLAVIQKSDLRQFYNKSLSHTGGSQDILAEDAPPLGSLILSDVFQAKPSNNIS